MVHAKGPNALDVAKIALRAALRLDDDRAQIYTDLILSKSAHRAELEGVIMDISRYEFQSDLFKRLIRQGREEALLVLLRARNLEPNEEAVAKIRACQNAAVLDAWIERAAVAETVDEIFD